MQLSHIKILFLSFLHVPQNHRKKGSLCVKWFTIFFSNFSKSKMNQNLKYNYLAVFWQIRPMIWIVKMDSTRKPKIGEFGVCTLLQISQTPWWTNGWDLIKLPFFIFDELLTNQILILRPKKGLVVKDIHNMSNYLVQFNSLHIFWWFLKIHGELRCYIFTSSCLLLSKEDYWFRSWKWAPEKSRMADFNVWIFLKKISKFLMIQRLGFKCLSMFGLLKSLNGSDLD